MRIVFKGHVISHDLLNENNKIDRNEAANLILEKEIISHGNKKSSWGR